MVVVFAQPSGRAREEEIVMSTTTALAAAVLAGAAGLALVAVPAAGAATAAPSDSTTCTQDGTGYATAYRGGRGTAAGQGPAVGLGVGQQARGGRYGATSTAPRTGTSTVVIGSLTAAQKADLAGMAEEEKLAHDLYVALAAKYPDLVQFARIARSESQHLASLQTLMSRYSVADPTSGRAAGSFASPEMQALYDSLLAGATSSTTALAAGVAVEKADIADLTSALTGLTASDVTRVYTNLRSASQQHLVAFGG
jgi:hypothetical protein